MGSAWGRAKVALIVSCAGDLQGFQQIGGAGGERSDDASSVEEEGSRDAHRCDRGI